MPSLVYSLVFTVKVDNRNNKGLTSNQWVKAIDNTRKSLTTKLSKLDNYELYLIREISDNNLLHIHGMLSIEDTEDQELKLNMEVFGKYNSPYYTLKHEKARNELKLWTYINKDYDTKSSVEYVDWVHVRKYKWSEWYNLRGFYFDAYKNNIDMFIDDD